MTPSETATTLRLFNAWRRGDEEISQPDPYEIGRAIDVAVELLDEIEAMEKQEPVAWLHETRRDSDVVTDAVKHVWGKVAVGSMAAYSIPLYVLPDAKGERNGPPD